MSASTEETRRLGRPADADSVATKHRIVCGARKAFSANGFEATTNKEIADAAGITSAALYHYFSSKSEIYVAVCRSVFVRFSEAYTIDSSVGSTLHDRLEHIAQKLIVVNREDPSISAFLVEMNHEARRHPEANEVLSQSRRELVDRLIAVISASSDVDRFVQPGTEAAFAGVFLSLMGGLARLAVRTGDVEYMQEPVEAFLHLLSPRD